MYVCMYAFIYICIYIIIYIYVMLYITHISLPCTTDQSDYRISFFLLPVMLLVGLSCNSDFLLKPGLFLILMS